MATIEQMERALVGADRAGDVDAARTLARAIKEARNSAPPQQEQAPAIDDPGFGQSALIGMGRQADRLAKGVKQMGLTVASPFSDAAKAELGNMAQQEAENTRLYKPLQEAQPWATGLGEASTLLAAPIMGAGMAGVAASAALPGLIEYGTPEERLQRGATGAVGGALGAAAGKGVARLVKPTEALTGAQKGVIEAADRLGVKLTSGEASGNRALKWAEASSADMPIASGIASKRVAGNDKAMAQAATRALGQQSDEVTEGVLAGARERISGEFDRVLKPLQVTLDKSFSAEVKAITGSKVMKELRDESVDAMLEPFKNIPQGKVKVSGEWFQQNKTALDMAIRSAYNNGQPGKAMALESFEEALDRAAKRSMGKDAPAYESARKQWANLRMLETGKVVDGGRVMPGRLDSAMTTRYKGAYKEGKIGGELADIAKLAGTLRPPPNSGTVPRSFWTGAALTGAAVEPTTAAMAVGAPTLLQGITASPAMRKYMTKGLMNLSPEDELKLLSLGARGGLLGAYGASQ